MVDKIPTLINELRKMNEQECREFWIHNINSVLFYNDANSKDTNIYRLIEIISTPSGVRSGMRLYDKLVEFQKNKRNI